MEEEEGKFKAEQRRLGRRRRRGGKLNLGCQHNKRWWRLFFLASPSSLCLAHSFRRKQIKKEREEKNRNGKMANVRSAIIKDEKTRETNKLIRLASSSVLCAAVQDVNSCHSTGRWTGKETLIITFQLSLCHQQQTHARLFPCRPGWTFLYLLRSHRNSFYFLSDVSTEDNFSGLFFCCFDVINQAYIST